jgi:Mg-chelatase subunit ChlD
VAPELAPAAAQKENAAASAASPSSATPRIAQAPSQPGNYGPSDGQVSVRLFGVEGRGTKFVYVFDRSTSMEGPPLSTAKQQLIASLESLQSVHQFHVIFFNQEMRHFDLSGGGRRIAFATDRNKKMAARFVGGITADGGTDRFPALRAAMAMRPDVIFFLTDADDPMPRSELQEISDLNDRAGVTITTIEFGRGPDKRATNFLTELARLTGGQYGYVDTLSLPKSP